MSRVVEVAVWWAALAALQLVCISSVTRSELVLAVPFALVGALAAVAMRRAGRLAYRPRPGWLGWLVGVPLSAVTDVPRLAVLARQEASGRQGEHTRFDRVELPDEDSPEVRAARRGLATLVLSLTPATFVADVDVRDGETDVLLVHRVGPGGDELERRVTR